MNLVVYADFNCPYSRLASARAQALLDLGVITLEWRAVEHNPGISARSEPVEGQRLVMLDRELEEVRGLLEPDEVVPMTRPPVMPNTAHAIAAFAAAPPRDRPVLRQRLFTALWTHGRDIGDLRVLDDLGMAPSDSAAARVSAWRRGWLGLGRPVVPTVVLPDGDVARGVTALVWLTTLAAPAAAPPQHWPSEETG